MGAMATVIHTKCTIRIIMAGMVIMAKDMADIMGSRLAMGVIKGMACMGDMVTVGMADMANFMVMVGVKVVKQHLNILTNMGDMEDLTRTVNNTVVKRTAAAVAVAQATADNTVLLQTNLA